MSELINELTYLQETKNQIKSALMSKGGAVDSNTAFRDYSSAISNLPGPVSWSEEEWQFIYDSIEWNANMVPEVRADWRVLPSITTGEQVIYYVMSIVDGIENQITLNSISGNYTVDWGDGVTENYNSNATTATHTYLFANVTSSLTAEGWKQAIIKITPQAGQNLTSLGGGATAIKNIVRVKINAPYMTSCIFSSWQLLQVAEIGENNITSFSSMFNGCNSLTTIPLLDTSKGTNFYNMFYNCYALAAIPLIDTHLGTSFAGMFSSCRSLTTIPLLDTHLGTNFYNMFQGCFSIATIPLLVTSVGTDFSGMFSDCRSLITIPLLDTSKGTNFTNMFYNCYALAAIPFIDTHLGTTFYGMFASCSVLTEIPLLDTHLGTNFSNMFGFCLSLTTIPQLDTHLGTNFSNMLGYCYALITAPLLDTNLGTNFNRMFSDCYALATIPQLNTLAGTNFGDMFYSCSALKKSSIAHDMTISYVSCNLGKSALVEIFTNLVTVAGQTITITGNYGAALLTAGDREIATNKGWTISG